MNANLVSLLTWTQPTKSTAALVSVNVILWFLIKQRPLCVVPLALLVCYVRYLWKHRIRSAVLVDPPDTEDWVTLSSYDMEHAACTWLKNLWKSWVNLRQENHVLWTVGTCTVWAVLAKIGTEVDFLTLLFVISNLAFVIFPILEYFPHMETQEKIIETEDLLPDKPMPSVKIEAKQSRQEPKRRASSSSSNLFEDSIGSPVAASQSSEASSSFYEGIMTRSVAAAAASIVASSSSVFPSGILPSSIPSQLIASAAASLYPTLPSLQESSGPDSLTPGINQMPDHEGVDTDPEDEFLFDAGHFDRSSSSSVSNSFEIIDDDL